MALSPLPTFRRFLKSAALLLACAVPAQLSAQITLAFQGAEPGDTWTYVSTGADAVALNQALMAPNIVTGTRSLVAGGNTAGGNCFDVGSGNGPNTARTFTFDPVNITSSNSSVRTLTFSWGNRYPVCSGTGWDAGENLVFTAYHDGVAQPSVTLGTGFNNMPFDIHTNQYTWSIPACVNVFYFKVSVTTNRRDELIFLDNVKLTTPAMNPAVLQPSAVTGDVTICSGTTETYSVIQVAGILYTWSGLPAGASFTTANGTAASYTIGVNWGSAAPGTYTLSVIPADQCGTTTGPAQTVNVTIVLPPTVNITASGPTTFCAGGSVTLTSSETSGNNWSTGDTVPSITVTSNGIYTLSVPGTCGTATASETITVNPATTASITASGPTTFCEGGSITLTSDTTSGNTWSTGDTGAFIVVDTSGTYILTVTDGCGTATASETITVNPSTTASITASGPTTFCAGGSVTLTSNTTTGNSWSTGDTGASIVVTTSGTYTLTVTDGCGTATAAETITVNPATTASITASGPTTFCTGGSVTLTSGTTTGNSWSTGDTAASLVVTTSGTYTLTVTDGCGTATASQTVTVTPLPTATISATATTLCPGDSLLLTASGGTSFLWSTGESSASVYANAPGIYTVTTTNSCGTANSLPYNITSLADPVAVISGAAVLCPGNTLTLTASGGSTYLWSTGHSTAGISVSSAGIYSVTASNSCGTDLASVNIVMDNVTANFTASVMTGTAPLSVDFTNTSSASATGFNWDLGNGSTSSAVSPSALYNAGGLYAVTLTATTANGCTDSYSLTITVNENPSSLSIPNVFSPNGDGINDVFMMDAAFIEHFSAVIFNRWGKEVARWQNVKEGWDGKDSSGQMTEGVYYYVIEAQGAEGKTYKESGSVTLVR